MANPEQQPTDNQTETKHQQQPTELPVVPLPARVADATHAVTVQRNDKGVLFVRVSSGATPLFSVAVTPENDIHVALPGNKTGQPPEPFQTQEAKPGELPSTDEAKEPPPITIEGYPVRSAKYDAEKQRYSLTIAHHPNPHDRKNEVVYYDLVAQGELAEAFYALRILDTRTPVHVTGRDRSYEVARKGKPGETKLVRLIELESLEKIQGRKDSHQVLREKVRLADLA